MFVVLCCVANYNDLVRYMDLEGSPSFLRADALQAELPLDVRWAQCHASGCAAATLTYGAGLGDVAVPPLETA